MFLLEFKNLENRLQRFTYYFYLCLQVRDWRRIWEIYILFIEFMRLLGKKFMKSLTFSISCSVKSAAFEIDVGLAVEVGTS